MEAGWAGRGGPGAVGCGRARRRCGRAARAARAARAVRGRVDGPQGPVRVPGPGTCRAGAAPGWVCGRVQPVCGGKSAAMPSMDSGPYPTEPTGIRDLVASMTLAVHTGPKPPHSSMS